MRFLSYDWSRIAEQAGGPQRVGGPKADGTQGETPGFAPPEPGLRAVTQPIADHLLLHATTRNQWRAWLRKNYKTQTEIWLVYPKKHTGRPRIAYNDAVEEALCFGWIDSTVRSIDDEHFAQRFSVRRPGSQYSQANLERLRALVASGRVLPDVLTSLPDLDPQSFTIAEDILEFDPGQSASLAQLPQVPGGVCPHPNCLHRRGSRPARRIRKAPRPLRAQDRAEQAVWLWRH